MTDLTIIDDLLVLLDDEQPRALEQISAALPDRTKQTVSSTLGRLIAKGWVERGVGRARRLYQISSAGRAHVTNLLDQIKIRSGRSWDGSWEQVVFNIPERERKRRDELRKLLVYLGYGRLHNSLWLSPWPHSDAVTTYINDTKSSRDITVFQTGRLVNETSERIAKLFEWDWTSLDEAYQSFIAEATVFLRHRLKSAFQARRIVYHFAKILVTDPKLPEQLPVKVSSAKQAFELYEKVRPFCYQEG